MGESDPYSDFPFFAQKKHVGVSVNGATPNGWVIKGKSQQKWMIWGYPHVSKPPPPQLLDEVPSLWDRGEGALVGQNSQWSTFFGRYVWGMTTDDNQQTAHSTYSNFDSNLTGLMSAKMSWNCFKQETLWSRCYWHELGVYNRTNEWVGGVGKRPKGYVWRCLRPSQEVKRTNQTSERRFKGLEDGCYLRFPSSCQPRIVLLTMTIIQLGKCYPPEIVTNCINSHSNCSEAWYAEIAVKESDN